MALHSLTPPHTRSFPPRLTFDRIIITLKEKERAEKERLEREERVAEEERAKAREKVRIAANPHGGEVLLCGRVADMVVG
jgi:hypothetical protein